VRPVAARRSVERRQPRRLAAQRQVVDAFFAAARQGRFDELVAVLDPDVVLRSDGGTDVPRASAVVRGAHSVAARAITFSQPGATLLPVLVNGFAGVVVIVGGKPFAVMGFTVRGGRVIAIDVLADRQRLGNLDTLTSLEF
jgi:RNA polymerase sigma-70 factor (ECF subfamily)